MINCWFKQVPFKIYDKDLQDMQDLFFTILGIRGIPCTQIIYIVYIILIARIQCYTGTVIQIFKMVTVAHIRSHIGIIFRILTDSYRMNERKYVLYVFIKSLYKYIRENNSKNIQGYYVLYLPVFCSNMTKYVSLKTPYSRWCYVVLGK